MGTVGLHYAGMKPTTPSTDTTPESDIQWPELRLLRVREAAEILGVSRNTLHEWINQGLFPHRRINKTIYLSVEDLRAGIDAAAFTKQDNRYCPNADDHQHDAWSAKESNDESSAA